MSEFKIQLPLFEGPFDLLLFFIERDELDIHDIPISKITQDFLDYINQLEELNLEVASEFILVAATLMRIKAKMLLPRPTLDEEGNEIDPREELVRHLLEYKRYKSVIGELQKMEEFALQHEKRGNISNEIQSLAQKTNVEAELQNVDLYKLLKVYQNVIKRFIDDQKEVTHKVVKYPFTVEEQKERILTLTEQKDKVSFEAIIDWMHEKIAVIFNFLAILELLQLQKIKITLGEGFNNFWIQRS